MGNTNLKYSRTASTAVVKPTYEQIQRRCRTLEAAALEVVQAADGPLLDTKVLIAVKNAVDHLAETLHSQVE
jgi:hypothetical protein